MKLWEPLVQLYKYIAHGYIKSGWVISMGHCIEQCYFKCNKTLTDLFSVQGAVVAVGCGSPPPQLASGQRRVDQCDSRRVDCHSYCAPAHHTQQDASLEELKTIILYVLRNNKATLLGFQCTYEEGYWKFRTTSPFGCNCLYLME